MVGLSGKIWGLSLLSLAGGVLLQVLLGYAIETEPSHPVFIAHAGGAVQQQTYTNSLEALNENYAKGFRFFEIDLSWTADGKLVAIHDWDGALNGKFQLPGNIGIPTEARFLQLKMKRGLTQLNLKDLLNWARVKGDAFIVTDVKDANPRALRKIASDFNRFTDLIIPQVYSFREYDEVRRLGYRDIILTLYRMKIDPYEVIRFAQTRSPYAITMHWKVAQSGLAYYLWRNRIVVYVHTVNDMELFTALRKVGVFGIYTDYIEPFDLLQGEGK